MSQMTARPIPECIDAFENGDRLNDAEVIALRDAYDRAAQACAELGPNYGLVTRDTMNRRSQLAAICQHRRLE